jgi:hypothetical protein
MQIKLFKNPIETNDFEDPTETILNKYPWTTMTKSDISINDRLNKLKLHKDQFIDSHFPDELRNTTSNNNHRLVS